MTQRTRGALRYCAAFILRGMADRRELLAEQLRTIADDLRGLVVTARHDPKERARGDRVRTLLFGGLVAVLTLAARKLVAKVWHVLTGEPPPTTR